MKKIIAVSLTILFLAVATPALAQDQPINITSSALVEKTVVNEKGEKELVRLPATKVLPGDEVIFVNAYVNGGKAPAENVVINNAIPENMIYVGETAKGENTIVTYSVDGGNTFGPLLELAVTIPDGMTRSAASIDVTHIRWVRTNPLAPGDKAEVEFTARLK
ncbi:MAG: hypothetical protein WDA20_14530 [Desulfuromonadales bacterium]